jgi:site-specific DNA-methyltransferase (adenine-specific)
VKRESPARTKNGKAKSSRNRTIELSNSEKALLRKNLIVLPEKFGGAKSAPYFPAAERIQCGTYHGDFGDLERILPPACVDLLILDPPYNLAKEFNGRKFAKQDVDEYTEWLDGVISELKCLLKEDASIYICGDWYSSVSIYTAASRHFKVRNRITWEREKGRGAKSNWKNSSEDIWFCTMSDNYTFNVDRVKLRRKVIAPYRDELRAPKDWDDTEDGAYRDTHPSNIWTDISIPFWSMPENTEHPTQKSEKLIAKLILASTDENDLVLDPFLGSGTSSVVAKKLGRRYFGCEMEEYYCLLAEKRLQLAEADRRVQGFTDGVFWERNTLTEQQSRLKNSSE